MGPVPAVLRALPIGPTALPTLSHQPLISCLNLPGRLVLLHSPPCPTGHHYPASINPVDGACAHCASHIADWTFCIIAALSQRSTRTSSVLFMCTQHGTFVAAEFISRCSFQSGVLHITSIFNLSIWCVFCAFTLMRALAHSPISRELGW